MYYPKFIVSNQKEESISIQRVNNMWMVIFQFPVSFVINFVLPKDEALKQVEEENLSTKGLIAHNDKQKGQSDEADKSRTQVRTSLSLV